jgi:hypothetical protein
MELSKLLASMKKLLDSFSLFLLAVLPSCADVELLQTSRALNSEVLTAIKSMPSNRGYDASQAAVDRLAASVLLKDGLIAQDLKNLDSTFCSGATYLVFLRAIEALRLRNSSFLPANDWARFAKLGVKDGEEIFGRWNANGPGTAKLFADLNCGVNFTSADQARPGDFLKMWWTQAIGGKERGHSVVYLSQTPISITFWSANEPDGYGKKTVKKSKIKHQLFSRLTKPANLAKATHLSPKDQFLADMLRKDFTWQQVAKSCKVKATP